MLRIHPIYPQKKKNKSIPSVARTSLSAIASQSMAVDAALRRDSLSGGGATGDGVHTR
jgi:hypothetical protein